jgi:hypothetical protein
VTFNDVTVDIDLSVYGKSSAEAMVGKRKQMPTKVNVHRDVIKCHGINPT